jgi:hypothetical protein
MEALVYGQATEFRGPRYAGAAVNGATVTVSFDPASLYGATLAINTSVSCPPTLCVGCCEAEEVPLTDAVDVMETLGVDDALGVAVALQLGEDVDDCDPVVDALGEIVWLPVADCDADCVSEDDVDWLGLSLADSEGDASCVCEALAVDDCECVPLSDCESAFSGEGSWLAEADADGDKLRVPLTLGVPDKLRVRD